MGSSLQVGGSMKENGKLCPIVSCPGNTFPCQEELCELWSVADKMCSYRLQARESVILAASGLRLEQELYRIRVEISSVSETLDKGEIQLYLGRIEDQLKEIERTGINQGGELQELLMDLSDRVAKVGISNPLARLCIGGDKRE